MSELIFYGLKSCDTCRKAVKALERAGRPVTYVDVRDDGVPAERLIDWLTALGPERLVNRRSTTWRGLSEVERAGAGSPGGAAALLAAHPTLMKRPVIVDGATIHVGWSAAVEKALV